MENDVDRNKTIVPLREANTHTHRHRQRHRRAHTHTHVRTHTTVHTRTLSFSRRRMSETPEHTHVLSDYTHPRTDVKQIIDTYPS